MLASHGMQKALYLLFGTFLTVLKYYDEFLYSHYSLNL